MGHLIPDLPWDGVGGEPARVLLMNYTVSETSVLSKQMELAVPTILDGTLGPNFFPTPFPSAEASAEYKQGGCAVNLTAVKGESEYEYGCELLHPAMDYAPKHFLRTDVIIRQPGLDLGRARDYHLPWVRLLQDREDFAPGGERES